jgi:hypothetical protein
VAKAIRGRGSTGGSIERRLGPAAATAACRARGRTCPKLIKGAAGGTIVFFVERCLGSGCVPRTGPVTWTPDAASASGLRTEPLQPGGHDDRPRGEVCAGFHRCTLPVKLALVVPCMRGCLSRGVSVAANIFFIASRRTLAGVLRRQVPPFMAWPPPA